MSIQTNLRLHLLHSLHLAQYEILYAILENV